MKKLLTNKAPLLILIGLVVAVLGAILTSLMLAALGGVLTGGGLCFLRTVNPDVPPPPPPKDKDK